jgi:hypothetical protein
MINYFRWKYYKIVIHFKNKKRIQDKPYLSKSERKLIANPARGAIIVQ